MLLLPCLLLLFGCRDAVSPEHPPLAPPPATGAAKLTGAYECRVDAERRTLTCTLPGPADGNTALAILGQNQVQMTSTNVVYDSATQILSADVTVQNLMAKAIGTPDGVDTTGIKLFFETGPTVTSYVSAGDTGTVYMANADSTGNFTGADQPYYLYDTILQPQEVSAARPWHFHKPAQVKTFSFTVRIFAAMPGEPRVPEVPPHGIPSYVFDPSNMFYESSEWYYPRNVVIVFFAEGTSQEEKQAAVEAVGGAVIGGYNRPDWPLSVQEYYIQIQDDGTDGPLWSAIYLLQGLPQVGIATPFNNDAVGPAYLKARDGAGWDEWQLEPGAADGENWALESVAMPMAWGCSTGSKNIPVAVVDNHFPQFDDLLPNVSLTVGSGFETNPPKDHGSAVASVLAGAGDNQTATTGVMWTASLFLYDRDAYGALVQGDAGTTTSGGSGGDSPGALFSANRALVTAIASGARVINLSMARDWSVGYVPGSSPRDSASVWNNYVNTRYLVRRAFAALDARGEPRPLIVIAAGNNDVDAYYAQFPSLARDFPEEVLVVGGVARSGAGGYQRARWTRTVDGVTEQRGAQYGDLVQVAAPAGGVYVPDVSGTAQRTYGTSFAAPHVAGLAGLLFSFDPRLTAAEVKSLILEGAQRAAAANAGRTIANPGGQPLHLIDAYESLRAAAERPGAPLCGNAVWAADGMIRTRRTPGVVEDLGPVGIQPQPLAPLAADAGFLVEVLHGGKHVWYTTFYNGGFLGRIMNWQSGAWVYGTLPSDYQSRRGGTFVSHEAYSHDRDTVTYFGVSPALTERWYDTTSVQALPIWLRTAAGDQLLTDRLDLRRGPDALGTTCLERPSALAEECSNYIDDSRSWLVRMAYPQNGTDLYVTVSPLTTEPVDSTDWRACGYDGADPLAKCRSVQLIQRQHGTLVYRVDVGSGDVTAVDSLSGGAVYWIGQSENDDRIVWGRGEWTFTKWADMEHAYSTGEAEYGVEAVLGDCGIEYRDGSTLALADSIPTGFACNYQSLNVPDWGSGGTIAPDGVPAPSAAGPFATRAPAGAGNRTRGPHALPRASAALLP